MDQTLFPIEWCEHWSKVPYTRFILFIHEIETDANGISTTR